MSKYIIEGGKKLQGKVKISGNKNEILPCLAACLLTEEEVVLENVPKILDVDVLLEILKVLGAEVQKEDRTVKIKCKHIKKSILPEDLVKKLRASILFVGPLLARFKRAEFFFPGGDIIGRRSIDSHLNGFEDLGFDFEIKDLRYFGKKIKNGHDREIFMEDCSVTGTENLILAATLGSSIIVLKNCAIEPHVVNLCKMLVTMGAKISGIGTQTLIISGVKKLQGTKFKIGLDHIEFGTYAIAAAVTGGEIEIEKDNLPDLQPVICHLEKMGISFKENGDLIKIFAKTIKAIPRLHTNIWPGFPTDLMSAVIVLSTQAGGMSLLHDWMYETRMFFVDKLISMGAQIIIADPHRVLVYGPTKLAGRHMESPDIRAGMALVLAALAAEGRSVIDEAQLIERGYEDMVGKLLSLGANIKRVE